MTQTISLEEIYAPIDPSLKVVPSAILDTLSSPNELAEEVIRHFFSANGKLLRPALTLLGAQIKGNKNQDLQKAVYLAAAFEIFHAATLIHDDIIDSAYLRRNIPTINVKWGAQVAVLVGDYLHDKAIGSIVKLGTTEIIRSFLETAGTVCDGEIYELKEKGNFELSEQIYLDIIHKKTAALLACTIECGARLSGVSSEEAQALWNFGKNFGIAFQIIDDCLDFTGEEQEFGKTLGADCSAGVLTLPLIRLIQVSNDKRRREIREIFQSGDNPGKFQTLLSMIRHEKTLDYSLARARVFCDMARDEISRFEETPVRQSLERLIDYVLERNR